MKVVVQRLLILGHLAAGSFSVFYLFSLSFTQADITSNALRFTLPLLGASIFASLIPDALRLWHGAAYGLGLIAGNGWLFQSLYDSSTSAEFQFPIDIPKFSLLYLGVILTGTVFAIGIRRIRSRTMRSSER